MEELQEAKVALEKLNKILIEKHAQNEILQQQKEELQGFISTGKESIETLTKSMLALQSLEEVWHEFIIEDTSDFISDALSQIFNEKVKFYVEFGKRGEQSTVDFFLDVDGIKSDIVDGKGGGYVNVVSFLLRILLLLKVRPPLTPVLFLDESFVNVSNEYIFNVSSFLRELSKKLGVQIILITHRPELSEYADNSYLFNLEEGQTKFKLTTSKGDVS